MNIGDKVFVSVWNGRNYNELCEHIITKVGRSYFYSARNNDWISKVEYKWNIKDNTEYIDDKSVGRPSFLYLTEQDYKDKIELDNLCDTLKYYFSYRLSNMTLEQAREIYKILKLS